MIIIIITSFSYNTFKILCVGEKGVQILNTKKIRCVKKLNVVYKNITLLGQKRFDN